ncbi:MAG: response regulator, partial [Candidatus Latescibacterota bacterium]
MSEQSARIPPSKTDGENTTRRNVLVVDDNEQNLYMLQVLLQGHGYEMVSAAHGAEALEKARRDPPDMIISDILMPVMDGFALCRAWKKDEVLKSIPFVFYTATYTDPRDEELALSLGAERFVVKPTEPDVFMEMVREILEEHQAGGTIALREPVAEEAVYYKQYNEALIRKLEDTMGQLEEANRTLEHDIAERKRAEETLRRNRDFLRALLDGIHDHILVIDGNYRITEINQSFSTSSGYTRDEAVGSFCYAVTHGLSEPCMDSNHPCPFREVLATGGTSQATHVHRGKDGATQYVDVVASPLRDAAGKIVGIVEACRDMTTLRAAEHQTEALQAQLLQAQKMEAIGALAGGVAHDFNNMLTIIQGYTELAMKRIAEEEPLYLDLKRVHHAAGRAGNLTRQLLLFSRRQPMDMMSLDFNKTVEDLLKMLNRLIGEDIAVHTDLASDLWTVEGDVGTLEQVIMNLAVNARDSMPKGGKLT